MRAQTRARSFKLLAGLVSDTTEFGARDEVSALVGVSLSGEGHAVMEISAVANGAALSGRFAGLRIPMAASLTGLHGATACYPKSRQLAG